MKAAIFSGSKNTQRKVNQINVKFVTDKESSLRQKNEKNNIHKIAYIDKLYLKRILFLYFSSYNLFILYEIILLLLFKLYKLYKLYKLINFKLVIY